MLAGRKGDTASERLDEEHRVLRSRERLLRDVKSFNEHGVSWDGRPSLLLDLSSPPRTVKLWRARHSRRISARSLICISE